MRIYCCPSCKSDIYFRNMVCTCGHLVEFDPFHDEFRSLERPCANREEIGCNWRAHEPGALCPSCATTEITPDLHHADSLANWTASEAAKRWVLIGLFRLGWFAPGTPRPVFRFLAERTSAGDVHVTMGHANGIITINIAEADPVIRTSRRESLNEDYRTLIGHFRHELAHYMHWVLERTPQFQTAFRTLFGDERADYGAALNQHYANGPRPDWPHFFITAYASAHPHEDWAESVAHLLHLVDILDSASATGLTLAKSGAPSADPYLQDDSDALITQALDYALASNHINRSMGLQDLYPFVLSTPARQKLAFVHDWVRLPHPPRLLQQPF